MTSRFSIVALLLAAASGCSDRSAPMRVLPASMPGGWRRTSMHQTPVSESPDPVPRSAVTQLEIAAYDGPGKLEARVYELTSPDVGVTLMQRWRPSADTVFFAQGRFFAVVKWQQADRAALQEFVRELEAEMKK